MGVAAELLDALGPVVHLGQIGGDELEESLQIGDHLGRHALARLAEHLLEQRDQNGLHGLAVDLEQLVARHSHRFDIALDTLHPVFDSVEVFLDFERAYRLPGKDLEMDLVALKGIRNIELLEYFVILTY